LGGSPEFSRGSAPCRRFEQCETELNPQFADGFSNGSAHGCSKSTHRRYGSADFSWTNKPWLHFNFAEYSNTGKQHAAVYSQPKHDQQPRHVAQRFALWNDAQHGKWSVGLRTKRGIVEYRNVELESPNLWKPEQQRQHVARDEPVNWSAVSSGRERHHFAAFLTPTLHLR
jgi:hypothetical protein